MHAASPKEHIVYDYTVPMLLALSRRDWRCEERHSERAANLNEEEDEDGSKENDEGRDEKNADEEEQAPPAPGPVPPVPPALRRRVTAALLAADAAPWRRSPFARRQRRRYTPRCGREIDGHFRLDHFRNYRFCNSYYTFCCNILFNFI